MNDRISIMEYMEDFDNAELSEFEWNDQMWEAVIMYNATYDTYYLPSKEIKNYKSWKRNKYQPDI